MPPDSSAGFVLTTPAGEVVVPTLALAVIIGVLLGVLVMLWLVQRRRHKSHPLQP